MGIESQESRVTLRHYNSSDADVINCMLTDPEWDEYPEPYLEIIGPMAKGTMLYCDYGDNYWDGRENEIVMTRPRKRAARGGRRRNKKQRSAARSGVAMGPAVPTTLPARKSR